MPIIKLNKNFSFFLIMCLMISYYSCAKKEVVNIYESEEYKTLDQKRPQ